MNTIQIIITVVLSAIVYSFAMYKIILAAHTRGIESKKVFPSASEVVEAIRVLGNDVAEKIERDNSEELNEFEV